MRKVIFITREGYRLPGARIRCFNFSRQLAICGVNTEVLSFSDNLGALDGEKESQMGIIRKIQLNHRAFKMLLKEKTAIFYIQRFNYHSFAPFLAQLVHRNKIILDLDDWEIRENPRYYFGFYPSSKAHYLTKVIAKRSVCCIAASRFLESFLNKFNKNVFYIPSGVDTELFKPGLDKNLNEKEVIFSWIGTLHRLEYIENINFALECFKALRKKYDFIYFDIVGDGIYKNDLLKSLNKFNDSHIRHIGHIAPDCIPEYLSGIHIGLMPVVENSKFNNAKSPTKLFEYMAMEKPTVSGSIGEAGKIVKDGYDGFLADNRKEFMEKMEYLIDNLSFRINMGKKARQTIEREYSLSIIGKRLYEAMMPSFM